MISWKATRLRKSPMVLGVFIVLIYILPGIRGNAQGSNISDAAFKGDLVRVKALIAAKADANAKNSDGGTALYHAACSGHLEVVQTLLAAKADVKSKNNYSTTPLMCAVIEGHIRVVQTLIAAKADVNVKDSLLGLTALDQAALKKNEKLIQMLKEAGAKGIAVK